MDCLTQFALQDKRFYSYVADILEDSEYCKLSLFPHHTNFTRLDHCVHVAYSCYLATFKSKYVYKKSLIRGALLHDFFLYNYTTEKSVKRHWLHGVFHPNNALKNALERFELDKIERSVIKRHMYPLTIIPPLNRAAWYVIFYDKYWAVAEKLSSCSFNKRLQKIQMKIGNLVEV